MWPMALSHMALSTNHYLFFTAGLTWPQVFVTWPLVCLTWPYDCLTWHQVCMTILLVCVTWHQVFVTDPRFVWLDTGYVFHDIKLWLDIKLCDLTPSHRQVRVTWHGVCLTWHQVHLTGQQVVCQGQLGALGFLCRLLMTDADGHRRLETTVKCP